MPSLAPDLDDLVRDRPLVTNEIVVPNAFYGNSRVLKRYALVPEDRPLKIALPHGVEITWQPFYGQREYVVVGAHYNPGMRHLYRSIGVPHVWHIAAPYVHVVAMDDPAPVEREGTIHFPSHSATGHLADYDTARVIAALRALDGRFQPVTVCAHWLDVQLGRHQTYVDEGFPVVTAGHSYDQEFLYRFHRLCSRFVYASGNDIGSHCFYAIKSGCRFFHLGIQAPWPILEGIRAPEDPLYMSLYRAFARRDLDALDSHKDQLALADQFLGSARLGTPAELRAVLDRAERIDRSWFDAAPDGRGRRRILPAAWRRTYRRPLARCSAAVRRRAR